MQESRRAFAKKAAIITAAAVATTGTVVLAGNGETSEIGRASCRERV